MSTYEFDLEKLLARPGGITNAFARDRYAQYLIGSASFEDNNVPCCEVVQILEVTTKEAQSVDWLGLI